MCGDGDGGDSGGGGVKCIQACDEGVYVVQLCYDAGFKSTGAVMMVVE